MVQRMTRTSKEVLIKCTLVAGDNWVDLLPSALLRSIVSPTGKKSIPYEIVYGCLLP